MCGFATMLLLGSCGMYQKYERPSRVVPNGLYQKAAKSSGKGEGLKGNLKIDSALDSLDKNENFGTQPWRNLFTSLRLQALIERALANNTDLQVARFRIAEAEASFSASRKAFLPSLVFTPQGTVSSFGGEKATQTYSLPLQASWQVDIFGRLRNAKEQTRMQLESSKAYRQAVRTQLIASVAREYYHLSLFRSQLNITEQTREVWKENVRAMKAFMNEGLYTDAAVSQAEANYQQVCTSVLDLKREISESENSICNLLGEVSNEVKTEDLTEWKSITEYSAGVPLSLLSLRPDVRQAEQNLASAFYATSEARSASLTLSGNAGWANSSGIIVNPGKLLLEAIGSIIQPIFQNGRLQANLKIAQAQQEEAKLNFRQALLNAGMEVNNALTQVQTYRQKTHHLESQIASLEHTVRSTKLLQQEGSSSYLEVLTAQESLLSARLSLLQNQYDEIASFIALYQALGGGRE